MDVIRNQHDNFISLGSQIASLHEQVREQKEFYLKFRAKFFNDYHDPFSKGLFFSTGAVIPAERMLLVHARKMTLQSYNDLARQHLKPTAGLCNYQIMCWPS